MFQSFSMYTFNPLFIEAQLVNVRAYNCLYSLSILFSLRLVALNEGLPADAGTFNPLFIEATFHIKDDPNYTLFTFNPLFIEAEQRRSNRGNYTEHFQSSFH